MQPAIPFNRPYISDSAKKALITAMEPSEKLFDGRAAAFCEAWLRSKHNGPYALATDSCTAALEIAAILCDLKPGDEVIMPSFTHVSTASAFHRVGATPVFVDIRSDTLNIDEQLIEGAVSEHTRAIVAMHYAGIACEMDPLLRLAKKYDVFLVEDAAHGILCSYKGLSLGTIGDLGTLSFHQTKNVTGGGGGALFSSHKLLHQRAEIVCDYGTDRQAFLRGMVDQYRWADEGSCYRISPVTASLLSGQLQTAEAVTAERLKLWSCYHSEFADLEQAGLCRRPFEPSDRIHNGHIYYLLLHSKLERDAFLAHLLKRGVEATVHYSPLHASPMGRRVGTVVGSMSQTDSVSACLARLPLWSGLAPVQGLVIEAVKDFFINKTVGQAHRGWC